MEFKREVAALASRPGATDEQVGRDLGVSAWSVARWRRRFGLDKRSGARTAASTAANTPAGGSASVPELERQIKALQRENADLREQRTILKKSGRHLLRTPALKRAMIQHLAGEHPVRKLCRTLGVARSAYYAGQHKTQRPRARENACLSGKARELFEASGRTDGSPRLTVALPRAGQRCGRRRVARLMRRAGLRARQKRRFRPR